MLHKISILRSFLLRALAIWLLMGTVSCSIFGPEKSQDTQPKWVTRLEYKDDVIEAVGYSCKMHLPEATFRSSDERAKAELASMLAAAVNSSIRTSVIADETIHSRTIGIIYEEVTRLYAEEGISGIVMADRYIDPKTDVAYSLARLSRIDAVRNAETKTKLAKGKSELLLDEKKLRQSIESILRSAKGEFIEATGQASVTTKKPKCVDLVEAMGRAELNARAVLTQRIGSTISNDVGEWLNAQEGRFSNQSSVQLFFKSISQTFAEVTLEGSMIVERYFGDDSKTVYAKVAMEKSRIAAEFSEAAAPIIQSTGDAELEEEIDRIIHDSLDDLLEGQSHEGVPEHRGQTEDTGVRFDNPADSWQWWEQTAKEGSRQGHFYGVGHGDSQGSADEEALGRLAKYVGVTVTSEVLQNLRSTQKNSQIIYQERIKVVSEKNLYGVSYRHRKGSSNYSSIALVPRDRVLLTTDALCRYHAASDALSGNDVSTALDQALEAAELLNSLDQDGFPIYAEQNLLLKVGLERLMRKALDMVSIKAVHPSGTKQYGIQMHTRAGQNLVNEKILYNLMDEKGQTINTESGFTGVDGHSTINWSEEDRGSTMEVIPQFITEIEGLKTLIDPGSSTERFRVIWDRKIRHDTEEIIGLWNNIQKRMRRFSMESMDNRLKMEVWVDRKNGVYYAGEILKVCFRANQDCYLVLCNIPVDNKVRLIFPNDYQVDNLVKGGQVYQIPDEAIGHGFRFPIQRPFGKERLYAFASTWPLDDFVRAIRSRNGEIGSVSDMTKALEENSDNIMTKAIGVEPLQSTADLLDPPVEFAHDWCIFVSREYNIY